MCLQVPNRKGTEKEKHRSPDFVIAKPFVIQPHSKALPLLVGSSRHLVWLLLSQFHLEMVPSWWPAWSAGGTVCCWQLLLPPRTLLREGCKQDPAHPLGCWTVMICNNKVSARDLTD